MSIVSKARVERYGEVFTSQNIVEDMLKMVESQTYRIDSRFLEPACGNGNFLEAVLIKKLDSAYSTYKASTYDFERYSILAVSSIYGIELLYENVEECRERLYRVWLKYFKKFRRYKLDENLCKTCKFILDKNIICGNALTMETNDGSPIVFSEWSMVTSSIMQRREFRYDNLTADDDSSDPSLKQYTAEIRRIWDYVN